jgi:hypothetical protein
VTARDRLGNDGWALLTHGPLTMWLGMSVVDTFTDSPAREARAFDEAKATAAVEHAESEIVQALLAEAHGPSKLQRERRVSVSEAELLKQLAALGALLDERLTAAEARAVKELLVSFGEQIARASGESLAGSPITMSQAEEDFLRRAREALGLSRRATAAGSPHP